MLEREGFSIHETNDFYVNIYIVQISFHSISVAFDYGFYLRQLMMNHNFNIVMEIRLMLMKGKE